MLVAKEKCQAPTQKLVWIGILFDMVAMTMSINPQKIEVRHLCQSVINKNFLTKNELESILVKLFHVLTTSPVARRFFHRLNDLLNRAKQQGMVELAVVSEKDTGSSIPCISTKQLVLLR